MKSGRSAISQKNVNLMLFFSAFNGLFAAIAQLSIFDTYLYVQSNGSNSAVGFAESISGITQIFIAIPSGILVDTYNRARILRGCGLLGLFGIVFSIIGIWTDNIKILYFSLFLFGVYFALQNSASYSLFSDSICQGSRSTLLSRASVANQLASGAGPFLGLYLFTYFGNHWTLPVLHGVLILGFLGLSIPNISLMFWEDIQKISNIDDIATGYPSLLSTSIYAKYVPYIIVVNDFITCIGAGMTVKFFPLFFKNDYGFSPIEVQLLFGFYGLCFGFFTYLCDKLSSRLGRAQSCALFSLGGVLCLFALAWLRYLPLVILTFLIRGALSNAVYPIDRSMLMDFVPSSSRGKWNAMESFSSMTWSGSAVLGGYLMDSHDYRYAFVITGYIYAIAFIMRLPLLWLVPKKETFPHMQKSLLESACASPRNVNATFMTSPIRQN